MTDTDVARFLRHLEHERRLSPRTVVAYRKDLSDLSAFLDDHLGRPGWSWSDVDRLDLRSFMGWCGRKGLGRRSVARKVSAVRTFYRFLKLEDRIPDDPTRALRTAKLEKRLPGHVGEADLGAVFALAESRAAKNTAGRHEEPRDLGAPLRERPQAGGAARTRRIRCRCRQGPGQGVGEGAKATHRAPYGRRPGRARALHASSRRGPGGRGIVRRRRLCC